MIVTGEPVSGSIRKLVVNPTEPVSYQLPIGDQLIPINSLIGLQIRMDFTGNIYCIECGRKIKKSFNQGYCFPCVRSLAACDTCIVKPELCHYHQGTCRDPLWGESNCMQPHVVYLANSSGLKVGITRASQIPTRWIDQGAFQALPIFKVQSRLQSGLLEVTLKAYVSDRTDWRAMLKGNPPELNLAAERDRLYSQAGIEAGELKYDADSAAYSYLSNAEEVMFEYPVIQYPTRVQSQNFDKQACIQGRLNGIKGQYLIFDTGVLNIRKFGGYEISFCVE